MQDAGEDVNPTAPFTPPQDARTTNTKQNTATETGSKVTHNECCESAPRRVRTRADQAALPEEARNAQLEGKHYSYGPVREGWFKLQRISFSSEREQREFEFKPDAYEVNARTGQLRGTSGKGNSKNWGTSPYEGARCLCREPGSQEFILKSFKKSHLVLAAVWPDEPINNVDHIDGNYYNNSVFNLDNVSPGENSRRMNLSDKGTEASKKSGYTRSHVYRMLDAARKVVREFTIEDARTYLAKEAKVQASMSIKTLRRHIHKADDSGGDAYGYHWERVKGPTRDGPDLKIVYFDDDLPDRHKKQIKGTLRGRQNAPKAFSNYGEIMDNNGRWTVGQLLRRDRSAQTRWACGKPMHHWMILAFHPARDEVDRWLKGELEILHRDGATSDSHAYSPYTHENGDDSKPYTNYYFTLRLDTRDQNQSDKRAKKRRLNNEAPDTQPIACRQENPKLQGTACNLRYEAYKSATTIAEFLEKGGSRKDLKNDIDRGYVWYISPQTPQAQ